MIYLIALMICGIAVVVEALSSGREPMKQLARLEQPSWAPPNWIWALIGLVWYGICYYALVRLLPLWPEHEISTLALVAMILANPAVNFFQLRLKRLDIGFMVLFPYWIILAVFLWSTYHLDPTVCAIFSVYGLYQLYVGAWAYQLWQMNKAND